MLGVERVAVKRIRPQGCECPDRFDDGTKVPTAEKCTARWIRCNARLRFEKAKTAYAIKASQQKGEP